MVSQRLFFIFAFLAFTHVTASSTPIRKIGSITDFYDALSQNLLVVVKVSSPSCGPCRQYAPTYEKVASLHAEIAFFEISIDGPGTRELAKNLGVSSIPATIFFVRGTRVLSRVGTQSPYQLEKALKEAFPAIF